MATKTGAKSYHANNAKIMIGTLVVAECIGVDVQEDSGVDAVHVTGTEEAVEHNHNRLSVSVSIQYFKFKKGALSKLGLGGSRLVDLPTFDVHAYDKSDGTLQFKVKTCTLGGRSLSINANQRYNTGLRAQGISVVPTDGNGQVVADSSPDATVADAAGSGNSGVGGDDPGAPVVA